MRSVSLVLAVALVMGCDRPPTLASPAAAGATQTSVSLTDNDQAMVFPKAAHMYGADMATWAERESQWVYGHPLAHNPLLDQTGADCAENQDGPVWFVPRIAGPRVFSGSRTCTIPFDKAIFLEIGAYVNPYPCPDPNFHPAPGQSLYEFLTADAKAFMDGVNHLEVSLDGQPIDDVLSYRFASNALFTLTGDPTFAALDPCVTGTAQPAIVDGFFMMFKPMSRGMHTIRVFGTDVRGANKTYVYHVMIA